MGLDKFDGKTGDRFHEQPFAEWREDLKDILRRLEMDQNASQSCMDEENRPDGTGQSSRGPVRQAIGE